MTLGSSEPPLSGNDRAVSPVVGVALLIAITVILAAVIGFVVLDSTVSGTEAPNVRLDFEGTDPTTIYHNGGDVLDGENVVLKVQRDGNVVEKVNYAGKTGDGSFRTGDLLEIDTESGDRIIVYWNDPDADRQVPLGDAVVG